MIMIFALIGACAIPTVSATYHHGIATENAAYINELGMTAPALINIHYTAGERTEHEPTATYYRMVDEYTAPSLATNADNPLRHRHSHLIDSGAGKWITWDANDGIDWHPPATPLNVVAADGSGTPCPCALGLRVGIWRIDGGR